MKNIKVVGIIFIGCVVVHQSYAGGPSGMISDEISDMTAGSVGRNVSREAVGEVADEAARVANKPSFAFHKPKLNIEVRAPVPHPHIEPSTESPFTSTPSATPALHSAPSVVEPQRVQSAPAVVSHPQVDSIETLRQNVKTASAAEKEAFDKWHANPTAENKANHESVLANYTKARNKMLTHRTTAPGMGIEAGSHDVERVFGRAVAHAHHYGPSSK